MTQKALDGISAIITAEVLSNLQGFINQVTVLSKQSKKIQEIINTIADNLDEKTQQSLTGILKRQNNEIAIIQERTERNKLPKCGFTKKNGKTCDKACKSGHKKEDMNICDEHFTQIESYRDEKCAYTGCGDHVKKSTPAVDLQGEIDGVSYYEKFLCAKHHKKVTCHLQKASNPCKFMVQSKEGERMCGALAVSDERCKKHHGKEGKKKEAKKKTEDKPVEEEAVDEPKKTKKSSKKTEESVDEPKNKKSSKKTEDKPVDEVVDQPKKKSSKKTEDKPAEEKVTEEPKKTKKGSKKTDESVKKSEVEIDVNFKGKRALNWISKKDEDGDDIFVDAHSGLVACEMGEDEESNKVVYAVWDVENNSVTALSDDAKKYAKKHKLQISDDQ